MPRSFFQGVRVTAVDNYQGEENEIILLSLVRSNKGGIGFLKTSNRVCVALSRAKRGFYCIGNMYHLASESPLWTKIVRDLEDKGLIGAELELSCQNHPKTACTVSCAKDFRDKAPEGGCTLVCKARLECGHECTRSCHPTDSQHKDFKCTKECAKKCERDLHPCKKKCFKRCAPCKFTEPAVLSCGHVQQVPCFQSPKDFLCQAECERILHCGHQCAERCSELCTKTCKRKVSKILSCGHKLEVPCHRKDVDVRCPTRCEETLDCGHICAGTCGGCHQGKLHKLCQFQCGRTLVCSHQCRYPCSKNCPPCDLHCENQCPHSDCRKECGELCTPCAEPCGWRCRHYSCSKLCGEMCDRPRCDHRCFRTLSCDHLCIGLCGEKCPDKCRVCDKETVEEIFFGTEDDPTARFIQLEDCGHVLEVSGLDHWMDREQTDDNGALLIGLKQCPRCKTAIRRSLRYSNVVKQALEDIDMVKRKMLQQDQEMAENVERLKLQVSETASQLARSSLYEELKSLLAKPASLLGLSPFSPDLLIKTSTPCGILLGRLRGRPTAEVLNAVENQIRFLKRGADIARKFDEQSRLHAFSSVSFSSRCKETTLRSLKEMFDLLMQRELSAQDLVGFRNELEKVEVLFNVRLVKQKITHTDMGAAEFFARAEEVLANRRASAKDVKAIKNELKSYADRCGIFGISESERISIVKAIGLSQGHWYKCPNGHPYAIGECGGATQEAKCPECGAKIGGQSHRLADGNAIAREMDGARHAAWSEAANLENFNLDDIV
eukprot:m.19536 g.19536  ORF g.19536 m.19536 type:complete len:778 (+) comp27849_c0_seq1:4110-6443(+)